MLKTPSKVGDSTLTISIGALKMRLPAQGLILSLLSSNQTHEQANGVQTGPFRPPRPYKKSGAFMLDPPY